MQMQTSWEMECHELNSWKEPTWTILTSCIASLTDLAWAKFRTNIDGSSLGLAPLTKAQPKDIIRWKPAKKDLCTTKEAFIILNIQVQVRLTDQGCRGNSAEKVHQINEPMCSKCISARGEMVNSLFSLLDTSLHDN
jgi:hypothetical protein